jgi:hypothetical protein
LVIVAGLLSAVTAQAQSDLSPAKSNCDSKTGCANYATGDLTKQNPAAGPSNAASPYTGDPSPAKSNCDNSQTGCSNYATGSTTPNNPLKQPPPQK